MISVDGVEAFYEQCVANGVTIIKPITATEWGTKDFYVEGPDGYIISFGAPPGRRLTTGCMSFASETSVRRLSTLGKRIATLCEMWIACGTSALLAIFESN